jgi:pantoate--beta-alanine ligase
VVAKLFLIVRPHVAVFGQKDAQQSLIIRRMARDLNLDVDLIIAPTIREADGLAMSSRNVYLSPEERRQAVSLSQALVIGVDAALAGATPDAVRAALAARIGREPDAVIDYAEVADTETLDPLSSFDGKDAAILLLAVRLGRTRLIDNAIVNFTAAP